MTTIPFKYLLLFGALFLLIQPVDLSAQDGELTKEEKKRWKDAAREYRRNLPALKALVEEHEYYQSENRQLQQQVNDLNAQISNRERTVDDLQEQIAGLNQRLMVAEASNQQRDVVVVEPPQPVASSPQGVVYRIQIGAYENNQLDPNLSNTDDFRLETYGNLQRVIIGELRNYNNALTLRDRLREMGVSDAFVVAYRDGVRVDVEDTLGGQ